MKTKWESEVALAKPLIAWLEDQEWEIYQEVQPQNYGYTADIVAVQNNIVWIIEVKKTFGLTVMEQAHRWKGFGNYISVAVPTSRNMSAVGRYFLELEGIGILTIIKPNDYNAPHDCVFELHHPRLNRRINGAMLKTLTPEHKVYAEAGNANGKRLTPFKQTCRKVLCAVKHRPGINMKELINGIDTHYSSTGCARSCLSQWIQAGKVEGIRAEKDGRSLRLYPVEE